MAEGSVDAPEAPKAPLKTKGGDPASVTKLFKNPNVASDKELEAISGALLRDGVDIDGVNTIHIDHVGHPATQFKVPPGPQGDWMLNEMIRDSQFARLTLHYNDGTKKPVTVSNIYNRGENPLPEMGKAILVKSTPSTPAERRMIRIHKNVIKVSKGVTQ